MKLTVTQLEELYFEGQLELEDGTTLDVVEEGDWVHEHKYQSLEVIFTDGERYYRSHIGRSGSEWTEWLYDSELYGAGSTAGVVEVEKREVTVTRWVRV